MSRLVRTLATAAALGTALSSLTGCGGGAAAPSAPLPHASSPAVPHQATAEGPPTLGPDPGGLTPVFKHGRWAGGKRVALTFDADMTAGQGPRAARGERFDNPALIELLRRLAVPATIFMTGRWAEEYPVQARSIGDDPLFEIANHSYSHYSFTSDCYGLPKIGPDRALTDVARAFAAFRTAGIHRVVPYFRFPGGCYDEASLRALAPARVTAVQWDVVSGDAFATDPGAVAEQVLGEVKPGSLVVLHCTRSAAPATEDAVARIVPELRKRGYRLVRVSELMKN
ncbi:polysaccharide deacetylase family protein [Streptomyces sp. NPDC088725]|uniref:polysaccharide deacetylase family protein n=1 Tax=Streptomyces sp. NPDC088725 TaxID=3365873 RepID=UPI00381E7621